MADVTRREILAGIAAGVAAAASSTAAAAEPLVPPAYAGGFEPRPLPFDPKALRGLSERLITSHHQNNYTGAVRRLNAIQAELARLPADAPPFMTGALKREELVATNSMILHELYFANLGGDGKPGANATALLTPRYGSMERWERDFRTLGKSLAGGSGWAILVWSPRVRTVQNTWAADHTANLAGGTPLLVMDMYEHAYQMDYGADAKSYIDAFFANVDWREVERRLAGVAPAKI